MSVRERALAVASSQVGVRETGKNSGPEVDAYLASVGLTPGFAWCAAFVHWCFHVSAVDAQERNPCPRTGGALHMRQLAEPGEIVVDQVQPGDVFTIDHGKGLGHTGFVELVREDGLLQTIEGNTNGGGGRDGDGVYRRTRTRAEINRGFLRFGA